MTAGCVHGRANLKSGFPSRSANVEPDPIFDPAATWMVYKGRFSSTLDSAQPTGRSQLEAYLVCRRLVGPNQSVTFVYTAMSNVSSDGLLQPMKASSVCEGNLVSQQTNHPTTLKHRSVKFLPSIATSRTKLKNYALAHSLCTRDFSSCCQQDGESDTRR